ncbi:protein IQ-DOMAIN 1 [Sesamum alatum]|uniref:Protein IQ-DOMAIN 1 n=1 Tax=Sesamum alatum TaxID=300844 RepID=A0AAE1Y6H3_9LAMI|nr:protein IQ-DOMAIN 1 [Sesamum alatum]
MGRKGSWFSSVKKALSPDSKEKKAEKANKSKQKWFGKEKPSVSYSPTPDPVELPDPDPLPPVEEVKSTEVEAEVEDEQTKHAYSVAVATAAAAEAAVAAAQAAAEVVRLTTVTRFEGKSKEEVAAIRIQTAFRGYLARRALRALRGLVRLKSLVDGPTAKRQTSNTLKCMQTLSRVQSQIQSRRIRMLEENRALQRQLLQKRARELESLRMGEEWDDSLQSKEQIEASLLHKYEAAMRRERALAYSYTHQQTWKKISKTYQLIVYGPETNPTGAGAGRKLKLASPRGSTIIQDDDSRSVVSVGNRRHSIAGSSVRDDESLASFSSVPSYMAPTRSAKAKSKLPSPLGLENGTPEKGSSAGLAKKRLSFPPSPARTRRHSGPPKVDTSSITDNGVNGGVLS